MVSVSVTRPNDTNAYTAGDVLGPASGSSAIAFNGIAPPTGGNIIIVSAALERDVTGLVSGETTYTLHLYSGSPPSAFADNAAWDLSTAGDRALYLGNISLGTPVDLGSTLYVGTDGINKQVQLTSGTIYGYLVTVGGYTPVASTVLVVSLQAVAI